MKYEVSILAALGAAVSFAFAAVLQQESTQSVSEDKSLSVGLLTELLKRRQWLAGGACLLSGFGLQALALAYGPVALVQPIVVTELAFAIPLGVVRRHRRLGFREWGGIASVITGISIFLLVASPGNGIQEPKSEYWIASLVPVGVVALAAVAAGAARKGPHRAMFLGAAAGLSFGVLAVLTKAVTHLLSQDVSRAFVTWQVYAAIAVGIAALIVSQSAYQAGPLAYSMPFVGVLEPFVAVVIGDTVLGEQVRVSPGLFMLELVAAGIACFGIVLLTTSATVLSLYDQRYEADSSPPSAGRPSKPPRSPVS
jgi:drug/metabolite transporter (DMT)-like permease